MIACSDDQKDKFGVEPMRAVLSIAPSTYYAAISRFRRQERLAMKRWSLRLHASGRRATPPTVPQGVVATEARRHVRGPLNGGVPHACPGPERRHPG
jgi:hypothetical protein